MASVAHLFLLATHSFFFHGADAAITCAEATTCADCLVASSSWLGSPCQWCTTGRLPATPCLSTTRLGGMLACALEGGPVEDRGGWTSVCPTTTTTTTTTRSPTSRAAATLQGIVDDPTTATTAAEIVAAMTFVVDAGLGSPALGPSMDAAVCVFYDKLTRYMIAGYAADRSDYAVILVAVEVGGAGGVAGRGVRRRRRGLGALRGPPRGVVHGLGGRQRRVRRTRDRIPRPPLPEFSAVEGRGGSTGAAHGVRRQRPRQRPRSRARVDVGRLGSGGEHRGGRVRRRRRFARHTSVIVEKGSIPVLESGIMVIIKLESAPRKQVGGFCVE